VFIAYGGKYGEIVAPFVAKCLRKHGMIPRIAFPGAVGEIQFNNQEQIFREEGRCDAVVAVSTSGSRQCLKFRDEVHKARYDFILPVVAFIQYRSRYLDLLSTGVTRVTFDLSQYWRKCDKLAFRVRRDILSSRPARYGRLEKRVARRVLYG